MSVSNEHFYDFGRMCLRERLQSVILALKAIVQLLWTFSVIRLMLFAYSASNASKGMCKRWNDEFSIC